MLNNNLCITYFIWKPSEYLESHAPPLVSVIKPDYGLRLTVCAKPKVRVISPLEVPTGSAYCRVVRFWCRGYLPCLLQAVSPSFPIIPALGHYVIRSGYKKNKRPFSLSLRVAHRRGASIRPHRRHKIDLVFQSLSLLIGTLTH